MMEQDHLLLGELAHIICERNALNSIRRKALNRVGYLTKIQRDIQKCDLAKKVIKAMNSGLPEFSFDLRGRFNRKYGGHLAFDHYIAEGLPRVNSSKKKRELNLELLKAKADLAIAMHAIAVFTKRTHARVRKLTKQLNMFVNYDASSFVNSVSSGAVFCSQRKHYIPGPSYGRKKLEELAKQWEAAQAMEDVLNGQENQ